MKHKTILTTFALLASCQPVMAQQYACPVPIVPANPVTTEAAALGALLPLLPEASRPYFATHHSIKLVRALMDYGAVPRKVTVTPAQLECGLEAMEISRWKAGGYGSIKAAERTGYLAPIIAAMMPSAPVAGAADNTERDTLRAKLAAIKMAGGW